MRPHRVNFPGAVFHITARGNNRLPIFATNIDKLDYLDRLKKILDDYKLEMIAFCLMPDHVHLLIQDVAGNELSKAMQRLQGGYAQSFNRRYKRTGTIYERRYHTTLVERDEHLIWSSIYIHLNPVKKNLAIHAVDYRWSSAAAYVGVETGVNLRPELPLELCAGQENYAQLLTDTEELLRKQKKIEPEEYLVRGQALSASEELAGRIEPVVERRSTRRRKLRRQRGVAFDLIWREVEQLTGIRRDAVIGTSRKKAMSEARALFCKMATREGISSTEIAQEIKRTRPAVHYLVNSFGVDDGAGATSLQPSIFDFTGGQDS